MTKLIWRVAYPLFIYEVLYFLAGMCVLELSGLGAAESVHASIILAAVLSAPVFMWLYLRDGREREAYEGLVPMDAYYLMWAVASCAALAIVGNMAVNIIPVPGMEDYVDRVTEVMSASMIWQIVSSVIAAPIVEEFLMRGLVYLRLRDIVGVKYAIAGSALIFGIFHGNFAQGVYAVVLGAYFAWLMERFGTILVPIMGHMTANLVIILLSVDGLPEWLLGKGNEFLLTLMCCVGCVGWAIRILNRREN